MKNIYRSPWTTAIGIIIALFTLAAVWFQKIDYTMTALLTITSMAFMFGKDTILTRFLKK